MRHPHREAQFFPVQALDKNRSPQMGQKWVSGTGGTIGHKCRTLFIFDLVVFLTYSNSHQCPKRFRGSGPLGGLLLLSSCPCIMNHDESPKLLKIEASIGFWVGALSLPSSPPWAPSPLPCQFWQSTDKGLIVSFTTCFEIGLPCYWAPVPQTIK